MLKRSKIILLLIITFTPSLTNPNETPFPTTLKLKSTIRRLNLEAIEPNIAFSVKPEMIKSSWNIPLKENTFNPKQPLSAFYNGATTMKFRSYESFNHLIAYNPTKKICVVTIWWDRATFWSRSFPSSIEDCQNTTITRINRKDNQGFLISYVENSLGNFNWFFLDNKYERTLNFNTLETKFFENEFLMKNSMYEVFNYGFELEKVFLIVYQRSSDSKFQYPSKNFPIIVFNEGKISNSFTPELKVSNINPMKISDDKKDLNSRVINIRFVEDFSEKSAGAFGISVHFLDQNNIDWFKFFSVKPTENILTDESLTNSYFARYNKKAFSSVTNELESKIMKPFLSKFTELDGMKGSISICDPRRQHFSELSSSFDYEYNCISKKIDELKLKQNEFFDWTLVSNSIAVTKIRDMSNKGNSRQVITKFMNDEIPKEVNTEKNFYSVSRRNLIEIPKIFPTDSSEIVYYFKPDYGDYRNITLENDDFNLKKKLDFEIEGKIYKTGITWVDKFVKNSIIADLQKFTLKKSQEKQIIFDYSRTIVTKGDFIDFIPDLEKQTWVSFTPMKVIRKPNPPHKSLNRKLAENLFQDNGDLTYFCSTKDYKFYSKNRKIHSFSIKEKFPKDEEYLLIDLEYLDIGAASVSKCININGLNLFILRYGKTYTAISLDFLEEGQFLVRKFYSDLNILNVTGGSKDVEKKIYRIQVFGGGEVEIDFENAYPVFKVDSQEVKTDSIEILGQKVNFEFEWVD